MAKHDRDPVLRELVRSIDETAESEVPVTVTVRPAAWRRLGQRFAGRLQIGDQAGIGLVAGRLIRRAEDRGRVDGAQHRAVPVAYRGVRQPAAVVANPEAPAEQGLPGHRAEGHRDARADHGQFRLQPAPAGRDLRPVGPLVDPPFTAGHPFEVLDRVRDIGVGAVDTAVCERPVQQPAGRADERLPLFVFLVPGCSPTRASGAPARPVPNTVAVACSYRSQRVHEPASAASCCRVVTEHQLPGWPTVIQTAGQRREQVSRQRLARRSGPGRGRPGPGRGGPAPVPPPAQFHPVQHWFIRRGQ